MASFSTNEFKSGLKILVDGDPCTIVENEFVKPGKGQAFNRVKIKNLKTGRVVEKTFKSGDSVMAADVIDLDELENGVRREGIFGAIYWWMVKFGFAIAGGLSGIILSVVGFDPEAFAAPIAIGEVWPGMTGLRLFFSGLPILGTTIAILVMRTYSIDEERANEIRAQLEARKAGA